MDGTACRCCDPPTRPVIIEFRPSTRCCMQHVLGHEHTGVASRKELFLWKRIGTSLGDPQLKLRKVHAVSMDGPRC